MVLLAPTTALGLPPLRTITSRFDEGRFIPLASRDSTSRSHTRTLSIASGMQRLRRSEIVVTNSKIHPTCFTFASRNKTSRRSDPLSLLCLRCHSKRRLIRTKLKGESYTQPFANVVCSPSPRNPQAIPPLVASAPTVHFDLPSPPRSPPKNSKATPTKVKRSSTSALLARDAVSDPLLLPAV